MRASRCISLIAVSSAFAFVSLGSAQDEAIAECAAPTFRAELLTSIADTVPRDGALVVGLFPGGSQRELPTLSLTRGRTSVALIREAIAPGLYRLRPDSNRLSGHYNLTGLETPPNLGFARGALPGVPTPPAVSRVERYVAVSNGESRRELRVEFDFPIPEGIVAVIAFFGDDDQPDLFARAIPTRPSVVLWSQGGRCSDLPEGSNDPPPDGNLRVAFVDRFGRVSAPSAPRPIGR